MKPEWPTMFPDDATLLALYAQSGADLRDIMSDMNTEQICATPIPGKWSTQQVMCHLADADSEFAHRVKRIIAEDKPTFSFWNENGFVARLAYDHQCFDDAAMIVEVNHRQMSRVFQAIGPAFLDRVGVHSLMGEQSARTVLKYATWHIWHHLKFVKEKKAALGLA